MPSVVATMPLTRKAVTFTFCQAARSSRRTIATLVSNCTPWRLCRDLPLGRLGQPDQRLHDGLHLLLEVRVVQAPVLVEARVRVPDGDFAVDDASAGGTEHLAQLRLGPDRPEHPSA